jgi:hypothetical protein
MIFEFNPTFGLSRLDIVADVVIDLSLETSSSV